MAENKPKSIIADRNERTVKIEWQDGHISTYSFDGLRAICPCVECRGGHANMGQPPDPKMVRDAEETNLGMERAVAVGAYAVQFVWDDGHSTGIYSWDLLRKACPCDNCGADDF
jgi:DUF971 family protein